MTYQEEIYYWLVGNWPTDLPADWPGVPPRQLKARMLRVLRMPHEEPDGMWYRRTVCILEREQTRWGHPVDYGTSQVTGACAHALQPLEDVVTPNFLSHVTSALFDQFRREGALKGWYVCRTILADAAGIPKEPR